MKKRLLLTVSFLLVGITCLPVKAYFSEDYLFLENTSLRGINTVIVDVDTPVTSVNDELEHQGVSSATLQKRIMERLQAAGINVLSGDQAISDPQVALLKLRIHLTIGWGTVYSWGLNLSLNQRVAMAREGSYYPVRTWSTGKFGGTQQTNLRIINDYSMELVDNFIEAHHAQN